MKLSDAAVFFDNTELSDAYSPGTSVFKGQFNLYDGSTRDGTTATRRVLSVAPGVVIPARKVVTDLTGNIFILGDPHRDYFDGKILREKYVVQDDIQSSTYFTTGQLLLGSPGVAMFVGRSWLKSEKLEVESSLRHPVYNFYTSSVESITVIDLFYLNGRIFRVRHTSQRSSGLRVAECVELEGAVQSAVYTQATTTKDIATDSYLLLPPVTIQALSERYVANYHHYDEGFARYKAGDTTVSVLKSDISTPTTRDIVEIGGSARKVVDFSISGDVVFLHTRAS